MVPKLAVMDIDIYISKPWYSYTAKLMFLSMGDACVRVFCRSSISAAYKISDVI